ncbi:MAG: HAD family hydrolase [Bacillota bacterium]|jgi:phosphoglycolate phosphatase|nr:HAD family hydrolase [Bacillota bacterium]MDD3298456.1 HAD family hydrolase [Bacillota bacterium]MDD3850779.1 HAD family hydrolase [Bacillota bacterium]MDD4707306.1 HAD family hydrolase [Bacillota bacterium]
MRFGGVIFDMDGTLLDTLGDLADSMNSVLERYGYPVHPVDSYRYFVGEGMEMLVRRAIPTGSDSEETVRQCLAAMNREYSLRWADRSKPYPGIRVLLDFLERQKIPKAVLSNKPDGFTKTMAKAFLSEWTFCEVRGESPSTPRKPNPAAALEIASGMGHKPENIVYIGDSSIDMQTAGRAGMYSVGALWGFRTAEELKLNGARVLVKRPEDVIPIIIR